MFTERFPKIVPRLTSDYRDNVPNEWSW